MTGVQARKSIFRRTKWLLKKRTIGPLRIEQKRICWRLFLSYSISLLSCLYISVYAYVYTTASLRVCVSLYSFLFLYLCVSCLVKSLCLDLCPAVCRSASIFSFPYIIYVMSIPGGCLYVRVPLLEPPPLMMTTASGCYLFAPSVPYLFHSRSSVSQSAAHVHAPVSDTFLPDMAPLVTTINWGSRHAPYNIGLPTSTGARPSIGSL